MKADTHFAKSGSQPAARPRRHFLRIAAGLPLGVAGWLTNACAPETSPTSVPADGTPRLVPAGDADPGSQGERRRQRPFAALLGLCPARRDDRPRARGAPAVCGLRAGFRRDPHPRADGRPEHVPVDDRLRAGGPCAGDRRPRAALRFRGARARARSRRRPAPRGHPAHVRGHLRAAARADRPRHGLRWTEGRGAHRLSDPQRARRFRGPASRSLRARGAHPLLRRPQADLQEHHRRLGGRGRDQGRGAARARHAGSGSRVDDGSDRVPRLLARGDPAAARRREGGRLGHRIRPPRARLGTCHGCATSFPRSKRTCPT